MDKYTMGFKFRIYPNHAQQELINRTLGCCRFVFNHFLAIRRDEWTANHKSVTYNQTSAMLTDLKRYEEYSWLKEVDSMALQESIKNLDTAYQNFFKHQSRYPRFKSKHNHSQSYRTRNQGNGIRIIGNRIKLPKIGAVKIKQSRKFEGRILNATVSLNASGKYFVSLCVELDKETMLKTNDGGEIGIDVGLKVIWAHEGHGRTIFTKFFRLLGKEQLAKIQLVSGDGAKWIQECINDFCPVAKRCIDPFHVVQWATEALDEVRRVAWRDALKGTTDTQPKRRGRPKKDAPKEDTTAKDLKGSRFALGKAPEHLTKKQASQLEFIAKTDKRLYRAYLLKEKLRLVFRCEDAATAKEELDGWIKWAQHCRIKVFVELQRKIRRHYDAILATMEHHLSNAVLEATNRKIKLSVYMAYGFRNIDNMIDMIMLRCSDIDVRLPWDY